MALNRPALIGLRAGDAGFYVTGGTLRHDAPSYVERHADRDLFEALSRGEFCYVLHARQMGKSSLMVRTAVRLREAGARVVALELTGIGQNLTPEQWYGGLLRRMGQQLDPSGALENDLDAFWQAEVGLGPLQRFMAALQEVVLPGVVESRVPCGRLRVEGPGGPESEPPHSPLTTHHSPPPLVIFLDEIDAVRSLPFSTDELFEAIRECYNRRAQEPEFHRLTFCLLGVASPSDLIRDTRSTPFNIGRRIELTDFTEAEALPLAAGLVSRKDAKPRSEEAEGEARQILRRVLHWTGGHPYLTQRLCQAVAEWGVWGHPRSGSMESGMGKVRTLRIPQIVDRLCAALFLTSSAREKDDNLIFVRERLLRSEADPAALLDLYGKIRAGKRVAADDTSPLVELLCLSGIVRVGEAPMRRSLLPSSAGGLMCSLRLRNRIYARVFDRAWCREHMPDAEARRQQAAYRRGLAWATALASVVLLAIGSLALVAVRQARRAEQGEWSARQALYSANMNLAREAVEQDNVGRTMELLDEVRPRPGEPDLRGWEWRYLWRLCHLDLQTLRGQPRTPLGHLAGVISVAFSPDGRILATGGTDGSTRLGDAATGRELRILRGHSGAVSAVAFSPDGRRLATAGEEATVWVWDTATGRKIHRCKGDQAGRTTLCFSPGGKILAATTTGRNIRLWDAGSGRQLCVIYVGSNGTERIQRIKEEALSPDGKLLAAALHPDGGVRLWDVPSGRLKRTYPAGANMGSVAFAPNGRHLAASNFDGNIWIWDTATDRERQFIRGAHMDEITRLGFSPDGRWLASGGREGIAKLWDTLSGRQILTLLGHTDSAQAVAFSPDGQLLATGSADATTRLWSPGSHCEMMALQIRGGDVRDVAFSSDSRTVATACGGESVVQLWDAATGVERLRLRDHDGYLRTVAFSPDGRWIASAGGRHDRTARLWDAFTGRRAHVLTGHAAEIRSLAFSPDGKLLATTSNDRTLRCWEVATGRAVRILRGTGEGGVAFSPDGRILAAGAENWTVRLWDVATGAATRILPAATAVVTTLEFSQDGRLLAAGSRDNTVRLWEFTGPEGAPRLVRAFKGRQGFYGSMTLAPDGRRLATQGRGDGSVSLWDTATGRETLALRTQPGNNGQAAFSPDGTLLATSSGNRTVCLLYAPPLAEIDAYERAPHARWRWQFNFLPRSAGESLLIANFDRAIRASPGDASPYVGPGEAFSGSARWAESALAGEAGE